jgi:hypothetical protein
MAKGQSEVFIPLQPGQEVPARSIVTQGRKIVDAGDSSIVLRRYGDEAFVYPDGVVVDVNGNPIGRMEMADSPDDDLANSATQVEEDDIPSAGGLANLTPGNKKKPELDKELAGSIFSATAPDDTTAVSSTSIRQLHRAAKKFRNADGTYDPDFLKAVSPDPATAKARMAVLDQMAGVSDHQRAAEQIGGAAQAREAAAAPVRRQADPAAVTADLKAARKLAGESLPEGDWEAMASRFNQLSDDQKKAALAALPLDTGRYLSRMLDNGNFEPNRIAEASRPVNAVHDLIMQRNVALSAGNAEEAQLIDAALKSQFDQMNASPDDPASIKIRQQMSEAIQAHHDRESASSLLRTAILDQDELVQGNEWVLGEKNRLFRAASPVPQKPALTPGTRSVEFTTNTPKPTMLDDTMATQTLAREAASRRVVGGGLPLKKRLAAARHYLIHKKGVDQAVLEKITDEELIHELPLFLKGNDTAIPFEERGPRADYLSDDQTQAVGTALAADKNVDALHQQLDGMTGVAEWRAAVLATRDAVQKAQKAVASGKGSKVARLKKLEEVTQQYNEALKSNPAALEAAKKIDEAYGDLDKKAGAVYSPSDRALNRAGPAQTYDDIVGGMTGFKNPDKRFIERGKADLSAKDRAALRDEADSEFGSDAAELMDDGPDATDPTVPLGQRGKDGRLGGSRSDSRSANSLQAMLKSRRFGLWNPREMVDPETGGLLFPDTASISNEVLSKQSQYPKTAEPEKGGRSYEAAHSSISALLDRYMPSAGEGPAKSVAKAAPAPAEIAPVTDAPADQIDNLGQSATDLGPVEELTPEAKPKGGRRGKKAAAKPAASAVVEPSKTVTGASPKTMEEIQKEANAVEKQARKEALADGVSPEEADAAARAARKKHVDAEVAARKAAGITPVTGTGPTPTTTATAPAPQPAAKPGRGKRATAKPAPGGAGMGPPDEPPVSKTLGADGADDIDMPDDRPAGIGMDDAEDIDDIRPVEGPDPTERPSSPDAPDKPADGTSGAAAEEAAKKVGILQTMWNAAKRAGKYTAIGAGITIPVGIALDRLGRIGNGGHPPGGPGGPGADGPGGAGGGNFDPIPVPPGAADGGSVADEEEARAAEIERLNSALNRVRGTGTMNKVPTFQTIQNYNGWR